MKQPEKSDGLLAKHTLLVRIIETDWASKLDHKVAAILIERYMSAFGNSRVSLRFLERGTRATRPNVIASLRRLVDNGAFSVKREGAGTRPTEYALNFKFPSGNADDTANGGIAGNTSTDSCGIAGNTPSGSVGNTPSRPSGIVGDTESLLRNPLTSRVTVRDISAPGAAAGLSAAAPRAEIVSAVITKAEVVAEEGTTELIVTIDVDSRELEDFFMLEHYKSSTQDDGQKRFAALLAALGINNPDDPGLLVGIPFEILARDNDDFEYVSLEYAARRTMGLAA